MNGGARRAFACEQVGQSYPTRGRTIDALEEITFSVAEGEFLCIVGPSGCGKTTLLKLIAGLLRPDRGTITFGAAQSNGRPRCALVFQEHGLFPWMTTLDNVAFGLETRGVSRPDRHAQARQFIEQVGLAAFADNYPHELSVGMRQRVAIARALLADPPILLMDEPFGSLDAQTRWVLQEEVLRIWSEQQKTVVYVTHDVEEAVWMGDRVLVMSGHPGHIRADLSVPLPRPRGRKTVNQPAVTEITWHIWKMLEEEVRQSLALPGRASTP